jgi:chromate transporter
MYFMLIYSFLVIGIASYGGGLVTVGLVIHEIVTIRGWLSPREMADVITLSQFTPGPIAINTATYTGLRVLGIGGAIVATLSVVIPSILVLTVILLIRNYLNRNRKISTSRVSFLTVLRPGILALLLQAVVRFGESALTSWFSLGTAIISFTIFFFFRKVHPFWVMLAAGFAGILFF